MNHIAMTILVAVSLVACSTPPAPVAQTTGSTDIVPIATRTATPVRQTQPAPDAIAEEAEIRGLVENFGKSLQHVSLLAPDAAKQIQAQYSEFVSPSLLDRWMSDVSKAPGRRVSSPWPDRIEITDLAKEGPDRYVLTGLVVEVTSVEAANGGAADKIPVRMLVQKDRGRWLISGYEEEQQSIPSQPTTAITSPQAALYEDPFAYCAAVGTIDTPDARYTGPKLPDSIVQAMIAQGIVSTDAPKEFQQNAVWRCMDASVWVCHFGANLPCLEKADLSQAPTMEMEDFCKNNPSGDNIPAAVTGRATVYEWRCTAGKPETVRQVFQADPQGYLANFWYKLTPR